MKSIKTIVIISSSLLALGLLSACYYDMSIDADETYACTDDTHCAAGYLCGDTGYCEKEASPDDECTATTHASSVCYDGDVYYVDSCGDREELQEACCNSGCMDGFCGDTSACDTQLLGNGEDCTVDPDCLSGLCNDDDVCAGCIDATDCEADTSKPLCLDISGYGYLECAPLLV
ncbi:hypothetical protein KAI87_16850, partial [Myxococcota bacterium]|nr:hypothetical protein [Myxococcota bacterium]